MDKTDGGHRWHFFRAGGVDQVSIGRGEDLAALPDLDLKNWVALSCPVKGLILISAPWNCLMVTKTAVFVRLKSRKLPDGFLMS